MCPSTRAMFAPCNWRCRGLSIVRRPYECDSRWYYFLRGATQLKLILLILEMPQEIPVNAEPHICMFQGGLSANVSAKYATSDETRSVRLCRRKAVLTSIRDRSHQNDGDSARASRQLIICEKSGSFKSLRLLVVSSLKSKSRCSPPWLSSYSTQRCSFSCHDMASEAEGRAISSVESSYKRDLGQKKPKSSPLSSVD